MTDLCLMDIDEANGNQYRTRPDHDRRPCPIQTAADVTDNNLDDDILFMNSDDEFDGSNAATINAEPRRPARPAITSAACHFSDIDIHEPASRYRRVVSGEGGARVPVVSLPASSHSFSPSPPLPPSPQSSCLPADDAGCNDVSGADSPSPRPRHRHRHRHRSEADREGVLPHPAIPLTQHDIAMNAAAAVVVATDDDFTLHPEVEFNLQESTIRPGRAEAIRHPRSVIHPSRNVSSNDPLNDPMNSVIAEAHVDPAVAQAKLEEVFAKWFPKGLRPIVPNPIEEAKDALRVYGVDPDQPELRLSQSDVDATYRALYAEMVSVSKLVLEADLLKVPDIDIKLRRILDRLKASHDAIGQMIRNALAATPGGPQGYSEGGKDTYGMWRFKQLDLPGDPNSMQSLLISLLNRGQAMGYKRHRMSMMEPIRTETGVLTGAWRKAMSFSDFVLRITEDKLTNDGLWYHLTRNSGNYKMAVDYLGYSKDPEIPWLFPDRTVFAFKNGIYDAYNERFVPYTDFAEVYPMGPPTACRYFELDLDQSIFDHDDYLDIPTPAFDQLLEPQRITEKMKRWTLALFIGRILYDVGTLDDWQLHPFVKGMSNTGKTKLLETIGAIYDEDDVGTLSNKIEDQFGLGIIAKKFIAIADDVRHNLNLDQSDFQNMASGTRVSCAIKHKDPLIVPFWSCSVIWSGNEIPNFHDNAGSFSRRLAIMLFAYTVRNPDGTLGQRLINELPNLIVKGNRAYRNMLRRYKDNTGVWSILPKEMQEQRREIASTSNALAGYLAASELNFGPDMYMKETILCDKVMAYARTKGYPIPQWNADYYRGPLMMCSCEVRTEKKAFPRVQLDAKGQPVANPKEVMGKFVFGCEPK